MSDPAKETVKAEAVLEILLISEIMTVLAAHALTSVNTVPAPWLTFLRCGVGNVGDRLVED